MLHNGAGPTRTGRGLGAQISFYSSPLRGVRPGRVGVAPLRQCTRLSQLSQNISISEEEEEEEGYPSSMFRPLGHDGFDYCHTLMSYSTGEWNLAFQ